MLPNNIMPKITSKVSCTMYEGDLELVFGMRTAVLLEVFLGGFETRY